MSDPIDRDTLIHRTRAAVCYANAMNDAGTTMNAFMAIFHPDAKPEIVRAMVEDAREKQRRER